MRKFNKDKYLRELKIKRFFRNNSRYFYIVLSCLLCCFLGIYFTYSKFFISDEQEIIRTTVGDFSRSDVKLIIYVDGKKADEAPQRNTGYSLENVTCTNGEAIWSDSLWQLTVNNITERTKCSLYFVESHKIEFAYTGNEQKNTISKSGIYKLEVWGAQGSGATGGYGSYSTSEIYLEKNTNLYINVGGMGEMKTGGYNGGGNASGSDVNVYSNAGAGGGATHIATTPGLLTTLESTKDKILIVAAGGGGASGWDRYNKVYSDGGAGGGIVGNNGIVGKNSESSGNYTISTGGTQTAGGNGATGIEANGEAGIFGQGGASGNRMYGGGGGGYYGGGGGGASYYTSISGAGGSSYIGNALLTNKAMYCYNCTESSEINTKTISTICSEEDPIDNCTKKNNGYAKITLIADINIEYYDKNSDEMIVPENNNYEFASITCLNKSDISWDSRNWGLIINDYQKNDTCKIYFTTKAVYEFSYTDSEQVFTIPKTGFYKLETWGAQGGTNGNYIGGYGGYSVGQISLNKGDKLYINVGGSGGANFTQTNVGGYNGGGYSGNNGAAKSFGGGGATHIATSSGLLSTFENNKDDILIVAAGGGGATSGSTTQGGSGGGYNGVDGSTSDSQWNSATYIPKGGTQDSSGYAYGGSERQGKFGTGQTSYTVGWAGGGGGGYYGGSNSHGTTGAGGSGYIGNYLLTNKTMYCYNCATSNDTNTKTISTICSEETPTENCAKTGNGYAKISYVSNVNLE